MCCLIDRNISRGTQYNTIIDKSQAYCGLIDTSRLILDDAGTPCSDGKGNWDSEYSRGRLARHANSGMTGIVFRAPGDGCGGISENRNAKEERVGIPDTRLPKTAAEVQNDNGKATSTGN